MIFTTADKPVRRYGCAMVRIEVDNTDPRRPLQRHIWTREDGSMDAEEWIDSISFDEARETARGWRRAT